ncbi:KAP family P-loop NTPase fold protein [Flavobacterium sp. UBA4197]|uniref:KAP family P-loop NTPase fold protein n=1 Tax=Flavobacterium sp. UBA4197 TaxID=1946546 RepID=UPI002580604B|nr:P-loop NTPase fold protein [Flavobacterium sp. UBA4197]
MTLPYFKKKSSGILWTIVFISLIFFFRDVVNGCLNALVVKGIISHFENTIFNGILLVAFALCLSLLLILFASKMLVRQIAVLAVGLYALTISSGFWTFYSLSFFPHLRIWDIIVFALSFPSVISIFPQKKKETQHSDKGFIEDKPIQGEEEDSFNRRGLAKDIAKRINNTSNSRSFAIGILGEYGSGKTSFINLIGSQLDVNTTSFMEFNPWSVEGKSNIQEDFFDILSTRLYKIDPKISGLILDYSRKLARSESSLARVIKQTGLLTSLFHDTNYVEDYQVINELLENSGKKIVVAIDDLDRLYNDEILEVLRIIRNTGNFTNIFYLVAYDRGYVDKAVATLNTNVGSGFLDKIIQLEIPLPKRETESLQSILEGHLALFLNQEELQVYKEHIIATGFHHDYEYTYTKIFRQSRDVIKFINGFKITHEKLKDEVFFESLFVLELLKFRFPIVYDRLYENKKEFISNQAYANLHAQYYELDKYTDEEENKITIIRTLRGEERYTEEELGLIAGLLHHMFFPFERIKNAKNSIIYPMFFERYFRYRLAGKELSEKAFVAALTGGLAGMRKFIDVHEERNMLRQVGARIIQLKVSSREQFELQVNTLCYLGPKFAEQEGLRSFPFDSLIGLFWNYSYNPHIAYYSDEPEAFRAVAEAVFDGASFPYLFQNELVYHIKQDGRPFALSNEQLTDIQIGFFRRHLERDGLSQDAVYIFYWTSQEKFEPLTDDASRGHKYWHIEDKMAEEIKTILPEHDPIHFLKMSIEADSRDKSYYTISRTILKIFADPIELRNAVADNRFLEQEAKLEFLEFFDACKSNDFAKFTEYNFKSELGEKLKTSIPLYV